MAISDNKILVSGCTDESIHIYNLRTRKEHGTLEEHEGLSFFFKLQLYTKVKQNATSQVYLASVYLQPSISKYVLIRSCPVLSKNYSI